MYVKLIAAAVATLGLKGDYIDAFDAHYGVCQLWHFRFHAQPV